MQTHMLKEHPAEADQYRSGGGVDGLKMAHQIGTRFLCRAHVWEIHQSRGFEA